MPLPADLPTDLITRAARVDALVLDVDGVLTDGRIIYDAFGDELKCFDVQDGAGLALWHKAGLRSAMITSRAGKMVKRRAKELKVDVLVQKAQQKLPHYERFLSRYRLSHNQACAIGDDLMELPILKRVGFAVAVPSAPDEVKAVCHYVTRHPGGRGAVREVIELILKTKGLWEDALRPYQV